MSWSQATPELPVRDVRGAQEHYRDQLGFGIAWHNEAERIGAVRREECILFLREVDDGRPPANVWIFVEDVDAVHRDAAQRGADIEEDPADKPWGLRQFTVRDAYGNRLNIHHDL
ncbi:MAG: glyoxalase/bleomycin resistance/extradiol dioxygenase family protein [Silicimonas sp.]|nr:glyoxalase/bleomycin resistance/extradiol dioxygenase family protein [Silicimonas sp.]NND21243.1 glyoxalase/bleomycin resistance/extradiol dioxygenase family protein [Silicimonas sp.]RZW05511.1 MAG: glyoxalase/bleomycin resistance/extradiol dioxygenase family protein [Paracoccaceae bacterium]